MCIRDSLGTEHIAFAAGAPGIDLDDHPLHPYVFSMAGFFTGGLIGLVGVQSNLALLLVALNGLIGIGTFGLLISTLSATFSRQS